MPAPKILVFSGSIRKESFNKKLAKAASVAITKAGGEPVYIDLADYAMPLYNGDDEAAQGLPENTKKLKALLLSCQGMLIACPEYNSSITPLLKNTLDWMSRPEKKDEASVYTGKVAALLSASPGALGGLRGLVVVRALLAHLGMFMTPTQLAVSKANEAFDADGKLTNPAFQTSLEKIAKEVVTTAQKLAA